MQRYLWQQADGRRHVYDTSKWYPLAAGQTFTTLCGQDATASAADMVEGTWFDPTCRPCETQLAILSGWSKEEVARLQSVGVRDVDL